MATLSKLENLFQSREVKSHYGHVDTNFFHYVTPGMIISVTAFVGGIAASFTTIYSYFEHNPPLNGMLALIETVGLAKAFAANVSIFNIARFLKRLEIVQSKDKATVEDMNALRKFLEKKANLLSMAPMTTALNYLETTGNLNIRDDSARLIKSKLGSRIAHLRANVNYFCGIMVMLGLIGTFWGLLMTISDVGAAMGKIADSMSNSGGQLDMGEFLQSIAQPLKGMGVGFSASLFGLGGSLFLGFFNYLATYAHDHFIENFGRWIDDRIAASKASAAGAGGGGGGGGPGGIPLPGSDDLKAWLAGFVYLAKESNQKMGQLFNVFSEANKLHSKGLQQIETLLIRQSESIYVVEKNNQKLTGIHNTLKSFADTTTSQYGAVNKLQTALPMLTDAITSQTRANQALEKNQGARLEQMLQQAQQLASTIRALSDGQVRLEQTEHRLASNVDKQTEFYREGTDSQLHHLSTIADYLQQWVSNSTELGYTQTQVLQEIKDMRNSQNDNAQAAQISGLVVQVNALLEEISNASDEGLLEVLRRNMPSDHEVKDATAKGPTPPTPPVRPE